MNVTREIRSGTLTVADQAVSSLTNFLLILAVGRWSGPTELGELTLVMLVWALSLGLARGLLMQPLVIRTEGRSAAGFVRATAALSLFIGMGGMACGALFVFFSGEGESALILFLFLPSLLVQDLVRWIGFSRDNPVLALTSDLVFLLLEILALWLLGIRDMLTAVTAIAVWGSAATVAGLWGLHRTQLLWTLLEPSFERLTGVLPLGRWLSIDYVSSFAISQSYLVLVSVASGTAVLGGWRAITNLLGPVTVMMMGLGVASMARSSRAYKDSGRQGLRVTSRRYGLAVLLGAGASAMVYVFAGGWAVRTVYGAAYDPFHVLVPWAAAEIIMRAARHVPHIRLQVLERVEIMVAAKLVAVVPALVLASLVLAHRPTVGVGYAALITTAAWAGATWIAMFIVEDQETSSDRAKLFDHLRRAKHAVRQFVGRSRVVYPFLVALRPSRRRRLSTSETHVVVEGFPRSGNTYVVMALRHANGSKIRIAHHFHVAGHVARSVALNVPTLIVVRQPDQSIASLLVQQPFLTPERCVSDYIDFHRRIWKHREGFVVAPFEILIEDLSRCVTLLNEHAGTDLRAPSNVHDDEIFAMVEERHRERRDGRVEETYVGRPSQERRALKDRRLEQVRMPNLGSLMSAAWDEYRRYKERFREQERSVGRRGETY